MGLHLWTTILLPSSVSFFSLKKRETSGSFFRCILWSLVYYEAFSSSLFLFAWSSPNCVTLTCKWGRLLLG